MDEITRALKLARAHYNDSTINTFSLNDSREYLLHRYIDETAHSLRRGRLIDSRRPKGDFNHDNCDMQFIEDAEIIFKKRL